jgi:hypothetical protein
VKKWNGAIEGNGIKFSTTEKRVVATALLFRRPAFVFFLCMVYIYIIAIVADKDLLGRPCLVVSDILLISTMGLMY